MFENLHPHVQAAAGDLFAAGRYESAVSETFQCIVVRVPDLTGLDDSGSTSWRQTSSQTARCWTCQAIRVAAVKTSLSVHARHPWSDDRHPVVPVSTVLGETAHAVPVPTRRRSIGQLPPDDPSANQARSAGVSAMARL